MAVATVRSTPPAEYRTRADEILEAFPEDLIRLLARLQGQPDDVVAIALSTLRYGSRTTLASAGVIDAAASTDDKPAFSRLTDFGRAVIAACGRVHRPDEERAAVELAQAREQWIDEQAGGRT